MVEWTFRWTYNNLARLARSPEEHARRKGILEKALAELPSWHRELPLHPNPLGEGLDDWYNEFLAHPDDGPYWWRWNIGHRHGDIETPIVHMGGWFDIFLAGTIKNFVGTRAKARTQAARDAQRLVVGPWIHGPVEHGEDRPGRGRLRVRGDPRLQRHPRALVRPLAARGQERRPRRAPRPALRDGREPLARPPTTYPWPGTRETPWYLRDGGRLGPEAPAGAEQADGYRVRSGRPGPDARRGDAQHPGRRLRPAADRGALPHLHERAARARPHRDRRRPLRPPRDVHGAGHRLRRPADRRPPRRDLAPALRRDPPRPLPRLGEPADAAHARPGLRADGGPLGDGQHLPEGPPHPRRGDLVELPAIRPQPEHRGPDRRPRRGARSRSTRSSTTPPGRPGSCCRSWTTARGTSLTARERRCASWRFGPWPGWRSSP